MSALREVHKAVSEDETGNFGCGIGCLAVFVFMIILGLVNGIVQGITGRSPESECRETCHPVGVSSVNSYECICNEPCPTTPESP